jgi:hypothetical protein
MIPDSGYGCQSRVPSLAAAHPLHRIEFGALLKHPVHTPLNIFVKYNAYMNSGGNLPLKSFSVSCKKRAIDVPSQKTDRI